MPGMGIHCDISSNNPFPRERCGRTECPFLLSRQPCLEKCSKENIVYQAECLKCVKVQEAEGALEPVRRTYFGETSRTLKHRAGQHLDDHRRAVVREGRTVPDNKDVPSSWIIDHAEASHGGILNPKEDIKFTIKKTHRDPLSRQVQEAALINWGLERGTECGARGCPKPLVCLNRKEEIFGPRVRFGKFAI